jgi:hypothetical protein
VDAFAFASVTIESAGRAAVNFSSAVLKGALAVVVAAVAAVSTALAIIQEMLLNALTTVQEQLLFAYDHISQEIRLAILSWLGIPPGYLDAIPLPATKGELLSRDRIIAILETPMVIIDAPIVALLDAPNTDAPDSTWTQAFPAETAQVLDSARLIPQLLT